MMLFRWREVSPGQTRGLAWEMEAFKTYCFWTLAKMWINTEKTKGKKSMNKVHDLIALTVEEAQRWHHIAHHHHLLHSPTSHQVQSPKRPVL